VGLNSDDRNSRAGRIIAKETQGKGGGKKAQLTLQPLVKECTLENREYMSILKMSVKMTPQFPKGKERMMWSKAPLYYLFVVGRFNFCFP